VCGCVDVCSCGVCGVVCVWCMFVVCVWVCGCVCVCVVCVWCVCMVCVCVCLCVCVCGVVCVCVICGWVCWCVRVWCVCDSRFKVIKNVLFGPGDKNISFTFWETKNIAILCFHFGNNFFFLLRIILKLYNVQFARFYV